VRFGLGRDQAKEAENYMETKERTEPGCRMLRQDANVKIRTVHVEEDIAAALLRRRSHRRAERWRAQPSQLNESTSTNGLGWMASISSVVSFKDRLLI
jgi:hypothetical protein